MCYHTDTRLIPVFLSNSWSNKLVSVFPDDVKQSLQGTAAFSFTKKKKKKNMQ